MKMLIAFIAAFGLSVLNSHGQTNQTKVAKDRPLAPPPTVGDVLSNRIKPPDYTFKRSVEYEGALMRLRTRAEQHEAAARPADARIPKGYENVAFDPLTDRRQGIYFFVIKY